MGFKEPVETTFGEAKCAEDKEFAISRHLGFGVYWKFGFGICWTFCILKFFLFYKLLTCCGIGSFFDYGLVWEWMSWVLCWVSILWMVWFGSGFVYVVVDDLIRWWCFAGC